MNHTVRYCTWSKPLTRYVVSSVFIQYTYILVYRERHLNPATAVQLGYLEVDHMLLVTGANAPRTGHVSALDGPPCDPLTAVQMHYSSRTPQSTDTNRVECAADITTFHSERPHCSAAAAGRVPFRLAYATCSVTLSVTKLNAGGGGGNPLAELSRGSQPAEHTRQKGRDACAPGAPGEACQAIMRLSQSRRDALLGRSTTDRPKKS